MKSVFSCQRLNLQVLAYLWQRDQHELLTEMIDSKIDAILIKTAALGKSNFTQNLIFLFNLRFISTRTLRENSR